MLPTVYTVQPGHYLWLYLIPEMDSISSNVNVNIDNAYSEMKIPVSSIPEGFNSVTTENGESDRFLRFLLFMQISGTFACARASYG